MQNVSESRLLPSHSKANTNITTTSQMKAFFPYFVWKSYIVWLIWISAENPINCGPRHVICCKCQYIMTDYNVQQSVIIIYQTRQTVDHSTNILCNPDWSWEWLLYFLSGSWTAKPRLEFRAERSWTLSSINNCSSSHSHTLLSLSATFFPSCKTWQLMVDVDSS